MRRELVIFAAILAVVLVVGLFGRSLMLDIAVREIKSAFPGYDVSVGSVEIRNADMFALLDIRAKKGDTLLYRIKSVEINFSPLSLFTRTVPKITIKNGSLEFNSPDKKLKEIIEYPAPKPGKGFIARSVVISNLTVAVNTADWRFTAETGGNLTLGKEITYKVDINMNDFNLAFLPKGLDAAEKMDIKGKMTGSLFLRGENMKITEIKGDFSTTPPGGKLVIKDEEFLKKLAENTKQPLSVIEEGFKNYDFTEGTLRVSRNADSILLHIMLDGAKGKRDITVALYNF